MAPKRKGSGKRATASKRRKIVYNFTHVLKDQYLWSKLKRLPAYSRESRKDFTELCK